MSQDRLKTVMAMPEAKGRKALAQHLATATDMTPKQMRACLAAAPSDPLADARDLVNRLQASQPQSDDAAEAVDLAKVDTILAHYRGQTCRAGTKASASASDADTGPDHSADLPEGVADETDMAQVDAVLASLKASGKIGRGNRK